MLQDGRTPLYLLTQLWAGAPKGHVRSREYAACMRELIVHGADVNALAGKVSPQAGRVA